MAYVLRFINQARSRCPADISLSLQEMKNAEVRLMRDHQAENFKDEIRILRGGDTLPKGNKLCGLRPFIDEVDGIMKVGGRLYQSEIEQNIKHPKLLIGPSHFTKMIIRYYHQQCLHAGPQATLYSIRQQFWFTNSRNIVRRTIQNCPTCARFSNISFKLPMGPLPEERITPAKPFTNTGIDFAGPFSMKLKSTAKTTEKVYISLFICFATKAIHLEVVRDLTTEACIAAIKRFIARRGVPHAIFSDNGTNFIGARNEIIKLKLILGKRRSSISTFATNRGIE